MSLTEDQPPYPIPFLPTDRGAGQGRRIEVAGPNEELWQKLPLGLLHLRAFTSCFPVRKEKKRNIHAQWRQKGREELGYRRGAQGPQILS